MVSLLLALVYLLQGSLFSLVPYSSSLITQIFSTDFSPEQYSFFFVSLGAGGVFSSLLCAHIAEKKGCALLFKVGIGCQLLAFYLIGMLLIVLPSLFLSLLIFNCALFFWGVGFGLLLPIANVLVFTHFPKKPAAALVAFYIFFALSGFLAFLSESSLWIFLLPAALCYFVLFLAIDFFITYPPPLPAGEPSSLKGITPFLFSIALTGGYITLIYNWWPLYLAEDTSLHVKDTLFSLVCGNGSVVLGRAVTASLLCWLSLRVLFWVFPLVLLLSALYIPFTYGMKLFAVSCFGVMVYSGLWPLLYSFGLKAFAKRPFAVSGYSVTASIVGYGFGSFIFGNVFQQGGPSLLWLFILIGALTCGMFLLNCITLRRV